MTGKRYYFFSIFTVVCGAIFFVASAHAASLVDRLRGTILLQVESHGEAWYLDPQKGERWYLGRPADAFAVMRKMGVGITTKNLFKIARDGSDDRADAKFTKRFLGRILLQVESHGEAWYVAPKDGRRYFLGRPTDAFRVMRQLGMGITDSNLAIISIASGSAPVIVASPPPAAAETLVADVPLIAPSSVAPAPSLAAPLGDPTPTASAPRVGDAHFFQSEMLARVNVSRSVTGAPPIVLHELMNTAAQRFSDDMAVRNYFAVQTPEGLGTKALLQEAGYEPRSAGIVIAGGPPDAASAFALWHESGDIVHKPDYEEIGVGFTKGGDDQNIWVVFFASSETKYEERIAVALSDIEALRSSMLVRVNQERAKEGLPALAIHPLLNESAQKKSDDMLTRDYFAHESPDGVAPHDLITTTGYPARASAENLAKGPKSVAEVMDGWMASPGHRANILLNGIDEAGFGLKFGRNASGFQIFWIQHFGKR